MPTPPPPVDNPCPSVYEAAPQERSWPLSLSNGQEAHFTADLKVQVYCPKPASPPTANTPVKIVVHGYAACGPFMDRLSRRWQEAGFRVYQINHLGHCGSSAPDPEFFDYQDPYAYAASIVALMDAEKLPRAHFDCHSMGALVCQALAQRYPQRVASLTLITPWEWPVTLSKAFQFLGSRAIQAFMGSPKLLLKRLAGAAAPEHRQALRDDPSIVRMTEVASAYWKRVKIPVLYLTSQISSPKLIENLMAEREKKPAFPVLIFVASRDTITPLEQGLFACFIYQQDCYWMKGGHQLPFEQSEAIQKLSLAHLKNQAVPEATLSEYGVVKIPYQVVRRLVTQAGLPPKPGKSIPSLSKRHITLAKLKAALEEAGEASQLPK